MDELLRALTAQSQGQARLPGLELQLDRANALRDQPFDWKGTTSGAPAAALGAFANLVNNSTGNRQAAQAQQGLEQARAQVAQGEQARVLHAAQRQAEQDRLAREQQLYQREQNKLRLAMDERRIAETERNNRFSRSQSLEKVDETLMAPDGSRVPIRHTNQGPTNAVTRQPITPDEWGSLRELPKQFARTGGRTETVTNFKKHVETPISQYRTLRGSLDRAEKNPQVVKTLSKVPTKFLTDLAKATTQSGIDAFIDEVTGTDLATSGLGSEEIKDSLLWWAQLKKEYLAPELHELFKSQVPKAEMQRFDDMMLLNDVQDPQLTLDRLTDLANSANIAAAGSVNDAVNGLITNPDRINLVRSWFNEGGKYAGLLEFNEDGNAIVPERMDIIQTRIDRRSGEENLGSAEDVVAGTQALIQKFPQHQQYIQQQLEGYAANGGIVTDEVLAEFEKMLQEAGGAP